MSHTHGFSATCLRLRGAKEYKIFLVWQSMIWRCYCESNGAFKNYGARGIKVCDKWRESFTAFFADMGFRPDGTTLGRKDNNGDYTPENCQWETLHQQNNNKRNTRIFEFNGMALSAAQWGSKLGLTGVRVLQRIDKGWSIERALTTPGKRQKNSVCRWQA